MVDRQGDQQFNTLDELIVNSRINSERLIMHKLNMANMESHQEILRMGQDQCICHEQNLFNKHHQQIAFLLSDQ